MKILFSVLKYLFIVMLVGSVLGSIGGAVFFLYFSKDLPNIIAIEDYKPSTVTKIYGKDDVVVGEFFEQRRYVVPYDQIPENVVKCFVAAEDDRFFEHQGVDFLGMIRAAVVNLRAGHVVQGGSTITQQVAKSLLLTPERSFSRKLKEVILASRMEKNLSKKQILYLYLNQIYFGEGAYGVEAASLIYYNKHAKDLNLAEAAILAGLPQAPSRYSPIHNPKKAKERQQYVLHRLAENGTISKSEEAQALKTTLKIYLPVNLNEKFAPYYVEYIRQHLLSKYGQDQLYQHGLVVKTPIDAALSIRATKSVQEGLRNVDKRHGFRGPLQHLKDGESVESALEKITEFNVTKRFPYKVLGTEGRFVTDISKRLPEVKNLEEIFEKDELYKALVVSVDDQKKEVLVNLGLIKAILPLDKMRWAYPAKKDNQPAYESLSRPSLVLSKGDVVYVRLADKNPKTGLPVVALEQIPQVQGALLSLDNATGEVLTMVGGYSFDDSEFNRAMQAERQPGSAYKPIIYSAAIDRGYTPATIIQDSPLVFTSGDNEKWKPLNYDEHFSGDITFRLALIRSMNIPTIKVVQDIGIPWLLDYTKRVGITKTLNPDYSIALGSMSISLFDLVKVYSIYPRSGRKIHPIFIRQVFDRESRVLEENPLNQQNSALAPTLPPAPKPVLVAGQLTMESKAEGYEAPQWTPDPTDPERVLDPRTAYVMTHLMNEVATIGTGAEAKNLKRAAAGKTGTTNDYMDAWFIGFTPQVTTGVWVGFDQQKTLGSKGTGGSTALPIWLDYMQEAVKSYPDSGFPVPSGVNFAYINGTSGRVVSATTPGAIREAFIEGTEPTKNNNGARSTGAQSAGSSNDDSQTEDFLKEDFQ